MTITTAKPAPPADARRPGPALWILLLSLMALFILATHWPLVAAQALPFDEGRRLAENVFLQESSWNDVRSWLGAQVRETGDALVASPLAMFSFALDRLFGATASDLRATHALHLALHVLNACLLALLLFRLFGQRGVACIAALIFGVHPITAEPIALVSGRATLLAAAFSLACLVLYVRAAQERKRGWYLGAIALYVPALLASPASMLLPVILILLDVWPLRRFSLKTVAAKIPFVFLAAGALGPVVARATPDHLPPGALVEHVLRASYLLMSSLYRLLWPTELSPYYLLPQPIDVTTPTVLGAVIGLVVITAALVILAVRKTAGPLCGWLFFCVAATPLHAAVTGGDLLRGDSTLYVAGVALYMVLCFALGLLWIRPAAGLLPSMKQFLVCLGALYLAGFAARQTQSYERHWSDTARLQQYMVSLAPQSTTLAGEYASKVNQRFVPPERSIEVLQEALARNAADLRTRNSLAEALMSVGRGLEAVTYLEEAIAGGTQDARTFYNLGRAFAGRGQFEQALRPLQQALTLEPESPDAHLTLGNVYRGLDRTDEAIASYRRAIAINPDLVVPHRFLAFTLANSGAWEEAVTEYREILRLEPRDGDARRNLGIQLNRMLRRDEALVQLQKAIEINPRDIEALYALGYTLDQKGNAEAALHWYDRVLALDPNHKNTNRRVELARTRPATPTAVDEDAAEKVEEKEAAPAPASDAADVTEEAAPDAEEELVTLNFSEAPIRTITAFFSDLTGTRYEVEKGLNARITMQAGAGLKPEAALELLTATLAAQDLELVAGKGGVVQVKKRPQVAPPEPGKKEAPPSKRRRWLR